MSDLPSVMRAVIAPVPGGPVALKLIERPPPEPQGGEILIRVAAAGVNRPDIIQRQGQYAPPPGGSDILGLEVAGEVVARRPDSKRYAIGARVMALVPSGGYADFCPAHESNALSVPAGLTMIEAAAIPETFFTVWSNVFERGGLKASETLLVHGGASGIGTTAIMLAKAFGARVITTVGSDAKAEACLRLGADRAINYRAEDFVAATKDATGGRGADVVLDMVGGDYVPRNHQAAAMDGRIVQIAFLHGPKVELDLRPLMMKRLTHTGSTLRPRSAAEKAVIADALLAHVWPLLAEGRCKPIIDSTFPLEEVAKAHERMESSAHFGKIVLTL
jgi:NADPH2:quinone reductase